MTFASYFTLSFFLSFSFVLNLVVSWNLSSVYIENILLLIQDRVRNLK